MYTNKYKVNREFHAIKFIFYLIYILVPEGLSCPVVYYPQHDIRRRLTTPSWPPEKDIGGQVAKGHRPFGLCYRTTCEAR